MRGDLLFPFQWRRLAPSSVSRLMSSFQPRPEGGGERKREEGGGERKKRRGGRKEEERRGGRRKVEQKHHGRHTRLFIAGQRGREREEEDRQELTTYH